MEKNQIRITRKLIALLVAGGITLAPIPGSCLTNNSRDPGTFVKNADLDETKEYGEYIVKEGDNLSKISEKVCSHLRGEISPEFWPTLAFLNNYPRVIKPGDVIYYPKTYERLVELNNKLQELGWTSKYKQTYKVYGNTKKVGLSMEMVGKLLYDIYEDEVNKGEICIDEDFIRLYLKVQKLDNKYVLTKAKEINNDDYFALTEWVPTIEELNTYEQSQKTKKKK